MNVYLMNNESILFWGEWCMIWIMNAFMHDGLCLFRSRSRGTRGAASTVRTALSRPRWVPSHNSLLVFVSSLREIYSATARTQSVSDFLSESQPVILIPLGQNPPNRWETASDTSGQGFSRNLRAWDEGRLKGHRGVKPETGILSAIIISDV